VTEAYHYENIPICHLERVWYLAEFPVEDWSLDTFLPSAFDAAPALDNADFDISTELVEAISIGFFAEQVIDEWILYGSAFAEVFSSEIT